MASAVSHTAEGRAQVLAEWCGPDGSTVCNFAATCAAHICPSRLAGWLKRETHEGFVVVVEVVMLQSNGDDNILHRASLGARPSVARQGTGRGLKLDLAASRRTPTRELELELKPRVSSRATWRQTGRPITGLSRVCESWPRVQLAGPKRVAVGARGQLALRCP